MLAQTRRQVCDFCGNLSVEGRSLVSSAVSWAEDRVGVDSLHRLWEMAWTQKH